MGQSFERGDTATRHPLALIPTLTLSLTAVSLMHSRPTTPSQWMYAARGHESGRQPCTDSNHNQEGCHALTLTTIRKDAMH